MRAANRSWTGWNRCCKGITLGGYFVQHQIGLLAFLLVVLVIALSNLKALRRLGGYRIEGALPRVSILAPARNEEKNIGACVASLLAQEYADYEVIVLDDNSSDGTGAILAQLAAADSRLQIMEGTPLPPGWLGKNWACHQLAERADSDLLLFVDADTRHHPQMLEDAVAALMTEQADLMSAMPRQEVVTWAERLVVPVIPWSLMSFLPLALATRLRTSMLSAAIGQFMFFQRSAYDAVGGHSAVRMSVVDDIALARRIKRAVLRWRLVDGTARVDCRMYRDAGEVIRGISRTLFAVFGNRVFVHLFVWLWLAVVFLEPIMVLGLGLMGYALPAGAMWLAGGSVGVSLVLWGLIYHRLRVPLYLALLYPASILFTVMIAIRSVIVTLTGRVTWKGRQLAAMH